MSRKNLVILAAAAVVLVAAVVASGGYLRQQLLQMHGAPPSPSHGSPASEGAVHKVATAAARDAAHALHGTTTPVVAVDAKGAGNAAPRAAAAATPVAVKRATAVPASPPVDLPPAKPGPAGDPAPSLGDRIHQWMTAFKAGEDDMRDFLTRNIAPEALSKRGVDERMEGYEKLRDRFGTLQPGRILSSKPGEIEAVLIAEDGSEHEFIFTGQPEAPYKIISIGYRQVQHGH